MPFSLALFLESEAVPIYHYSCLVFHVVGKQAKGSRRSIIWYKKNCTGVSENVNSLDLIMGRSWVAVEQTLKFLPLARVRNDIVYEPEASRQCHSLREQEEEISMSARLPPRNDIVSIYVKPPLNKARKEILNVFLQWEMSLLTTFLIAIECHCHRLCK